MLHCEHNDMVCLSFALYALIVCWPLVGPQDIDFDWSIDCMPACTAQMTVILVSTQCVHSSIIACLHTASHHKQA